MTNLPVVFSVLIKIIGLIYSLLRLSYEEAAWFFYSFDVSTSPAQKEKDFPKFFSPTVDSLLLISSA